MAATPVQVAVLDDYQGIATPKFAHLVDQGKISVTYFPNTLNVRNADEREAQIKRLQPFEILSTMRERSLFNADILGSLPNLKVLLTTGARNFAIDHEFAATKGIVVAGTQRTSEAANGPDPTTQQTWALILGLAKHIAREDNALKTDKSYWQGQDLAISLPGKTLGLLGLGRLGQASAKIAILAFGMKVVAWSSSLTQEKADAAAAEIGLPAGSIRVAASKLDLLREADVVSLHYVLSERSRGLVGKEELAAMKPSALLINTSRGPLVDEAALFETLKAGKIRGAAIDVFDIEPLPADSPWRTTEWGKNGRSEVLLSPHMGYAVEDYIGSLYDQVVENLERHLAGQELLLEMAEQTIPQMRGLPLALHGTIIHTLDASTLEILQDCLLIIDSDGKIEKIFKDTPADKVNACISQAGHSPDVFPVKYLRRGEFLIPGFIDTHYHAPQYAQRGLGRDQTLLEWLENVTFAHERKFEDVAYAKRMYTACVQAGIKQGVTTASYYGSVHVEATKILAETCLEQRQRAFVGKCNMNRSSPEWYRDVSAEESLKETRELVAHVRSIDSEGKLVKPILTPRFAITCDDTLLSGLGRIVDETPDIHVQTHFNEAVDEMEYTRQLYPQFQHEADLYDEFGLLGPQTILAHSIFLKEEEMDRIKAKGCGIAHCPISTATLGEFMMAPIREYLRRGIKVGLGTDVGGGFSSSMLDIMRHAFIISKARETFTKGADPALKLNEGFFLATLGGAQVCGIHDKVGNFIEGKEFDALEIHTIGSEPCGSLGVMSPIEDEDSIEAIFEKFLMTGDDRNIAKVYIAGQSVKETA
ncbi:hypothetical protein UA08_03294 [Talaromyces atroroseus]|uniref:Probable guanine deaminase n=1 Tax=Talaromyces atroroseus TaxID=1441469 RepID=A0A225AUK0_TALAT|nr:hypothetical protein UA08_03294 [Talaromyces atroroseus]OKL60978.1 hypothetical protein UA08_03294 [Talaromyces atroroseus]